VIDPKAAKVTDMFALEECQSAGLALGPNGHLLVGCSGDAIDAGFDSKSVILDTADGSVVASISDVGGSDEVWYNPGDHRFYLAARDDPSGPSLGVIDARSSEWIGNVPTAKDAKEVVADSDSNEVYVALTPTSEAFANDKARGLSCKHGCVGVYAETRVQAGCGPNPAGSN
jgi:DNA-binding beta-propeller fold protein YncE